jgi:hypothetical protein
MALSMDNLGYTSGINSPWYQRTMQSTPGYQLATPQITQAATGLAGTAGSVAGAMGKANPYIAAGSLALGALETIIAARKLKKLDKQKPLGYQVTPEEQEVYQRSKDMASYGFSQQEKDAYMNQMRQQSNVAFQRAKTLAGGSLGSALSAATSRQDMTNFAQADARLRQQKEGQFQSAAMDVSRKRDLMMQQELSDYARKQQAWGGALQSGLSQLGSVANLMTASSYGQGA